jgi:hypothetical protein
MPSCTADIRFRGKADMTFRGANVRLWPNAAKLLILQAQGFPFLQCFTILFAGRSSGERDALAQQHEKRELLLQRVTADSGIVGSTV